MDKRLFTKIQKLARQNTGSSLCDSGSIYGYNYNHPLSTRAIIVKKDEENKFEGMYISLPHFLAYTLTETPESRKLNISLKKFANKKEYKEMYWNEIFDKFGEKKGFKTNSDNTYNRETDLNQDFQYTLFEPKGCEDSYYSEGCFIAIRIHTGCDIRGGYSDPIILSFQTGTIAESGFTDMTLGMYVDADFEDRDDFGFDEFAVGYSSNPQFYISQNKYIEKILVKKVNNFEEFELVLKDGRKVPAYIDVAFER